MARIKGDKMKRYLFDTSTTMKPYNAKKWWIDFATVSPLIVEAENITEALKKYQTTLKEKYGITITNNGLKTAEPMYIDDKDGNAIQTGLVITAKTEFLDDNSHKWTSQYIELWTSVNILQNAFAK